MKKRFRHPKKGCVFYRSFVGAVCTGARDTLEWKDSRSNSSAVNIGTGTAITADGARDGPDHVFLKIALA